MGLRRRLKLEEFEQRASGMTLGRRSRSYPRAFPGDAWREGSADMRGGICAAQLRCADEVAQTRTEDLHSARRRRGTCRRGQHVVRARHYRRLVRRDARRPYRVSDGSATEFKAKRSGTCRVGSSISRSPSTTKPSATRLSCGPSIAYQDHAGTMAELQHFFPGSHRRAKCQAVQVSPPPKSHHA